MNKTLYIKSMVCLRCIKAVEKVFRDQDIQVLSVHLGEVTVRKEPSHKVTEQLRQKLQSLGFDLLESAKSALISKIKALVVELVHNAEKPLTTNYSNYLAEKLNQEYSYLSRLFSSTEGITIERYITTQKMERVKELLFYDEKTLSQIANQLNYSSVAYLSAQFKKETGMAPSAFKQALTGGTRHRPPDSL